MKRLLGAGISALIIWFIWSHFGVQGIVAAARRCDPWWLTAGLACVVPLTLASAWRFRVLARSNLSLWQSTRLILSSSTLNLFLPSKMGDLAKALVLSSRHGTDKSLAFAIVVLEKLLDLASLLVWGVLALLWVSAGDPLMWVACAAVAALLALLLFLIVPFSPAGATMRILGGLLPGKLGRTTREFSEVWTEVIRWFWAERRRAVGVIALSLALWVGHLAQFWLFAHALGSAVPFADNIAFATLSILVGLAPFTMAGIGTRDAAIIFFYRAWMEPGQAALLGVLATMRYLMPAIAGLPYLHDYLPKRRVMTE